MKLRMQGNSVRLRLSQRELAEFRERGRVEERVDLPGNTLVYALAASEDTVSANATFGDGVLEVRVPARDARLWTESEQVGIEGEQSLGEGRVLTIAVEKDFQCLHRREEGDVDAFPNPLAVETA